MDLNSLVTDKVNGPFSLTHFTKPWGAADPDQDVFFDNFSNSIILHKDGKFTIQEMHDSAYN